MEKIMNIPVTFDPCGHYTHLSDDDMIEACGYIPSFLIEGHRDKMTAADAIKTYYVFGWRPMEGFTVKNEALQYPGDPDIHPYVRIEYSNDETVWIFPYGWTRINDEIARLD